MVIRREQRKLSEILQQVSAHLGFRVKTLRVKKGVSVTRLAHLLKVRQESVLAMEIGAREIKADELFAVAAVLDVEPAYFYEGLREALARSCRRLR